MFEEELANYQEVINDVVERQHKPLTPHSRYFIHLLRDLASSFWSCVIKATVTAEVLASEGPLFCEENPRIADVKDIVEQVYSGYSEEQYSKGIRRAIKGVDLWDYTQLNQANVETVVKYIKELIQ